MPPFTPWRPFREWTMDRLRRRSWFFDASGKLWGPYIDHAKARDIVAYLKE